MKKLMMMAILLIGGLTAQAQFPVTYNTFNYNVSYRVAPVNTYTTYTMPVAYNFYFGNGLPVAPLHVFLYTW